MSGICSAHKGHRIGCPRCEAGPTRDWAEVEAEKIASDWGLKPGQQILLTIKIATALRETRKRAIEDAAKVISKHAIAEAEYLAAEIRALGESK